jgi:hypothetical protein
MLNRTLGLRARISVAALVLAAGFGACGLAGCEHKERVVDVKTPVGDVQVDKTVKPNGDTTGVEVKAPGVEVNTKEK